MQWDLFCRVVDNLGDIGVCWRLAADLAARGERTRLFVDDASALQWMAPAGATGVVVTDWAGAARAADPGDVVIEAFGCELPAAFVTRMVGRARPPVWINLEYLSAEGYVERSHGLRSPQTRGPGAGLDKWFFYPGFTARTGGLIREPALVQRQRWFDAPAWLAAHRATPMPGEQIVSLFCYDNGALPALLDHLSARPTLLIATAGHAARQVAALLGPSMQRGALRARALPALTQVDFDHLLWASNLNFVRGEDSFVRAQWAGVPFVWQAYPQSDSVHLDKMEAFLERFLVGAPPGLDAPLRQVWRTWNSAARPLPSMWPDPQLWRQHCAAWCETLCGQIDLGSQLLSFAAESR